MGRYILATLAMVFCLSSYSLAQDYKTEAAYLTLRDSMHRAFNDGDSTRFFTAVKNLQDYLLEQNDLHAYYTQRCNEIVFLMNRQKIFEAYKLARQLSKELREKQLDKEMYMAINMMGHIYRYCGNEESAKQCFREVIQRMEDAGYRESMPPIYMNIVNVEMDDHPQEAMKLLEQAREIAAETSPERVFDIDVRRTLGYYSMGEKEKFLEGYKAYKEGEAKGLSSVHARSLEIYYQACLGNVDKAVEMARQDLADDGYSTIANIYKDAGRWKEAYEALQQQTKASDSINSIILSNSMQGIQDELHLYELEHEAAKNRMVTMTVIIALLLLLIMALVYIVLSRRRHMHQLRNAYQHALESDKMKTAFIQNVSHEVRTPLNIISGFAQVIADPELTDSVEERQHMSKMMQKSAQEVTTLIDEILGLSLIESSSVQSKDDNVQVNRLLRNVLDDYSEQATAETQLSVESQLEDGFTLRTNMSMFRRIVSSLTHNAVKYTEKGHVTLKAQADGQNLVIAVEDTGCGIPANEAEHVFGRFVKLDSFKEGIGLGLPLSRTFAEQLGGTVRLDTSYTEGARFIVTIPIINND